MNAPAINNRRLKPGELRDAVLEVLRSGGTWTVAELTQGVARKLGDHSSGAVGHACKSLQRSGLAAEAGTGPRRYRCAATATQPATTSVRAPAAAGASPGPRGTYRPRTLEGISDVEALQRLRHSGLSVLLDGPPGTGKTALMRAAFADQLIIIAGDADTTTDDIVGTYVPGGSPGTFTWSDGPLVTALAQGKVLLLDDVTLIPPTVLAVTYPAMDGQGVITVKGSSTTVTAAPGFLVAGCHNPGAEGAVLTAALASRFNVRIRVPTDLDLAEAAGLDRDAVTIARTLHRLRASEQVRWAPEYRDLESFEALRNALGKPAALANLLACAPEEDREQVQNTIRQVTHRIVQPLSLGGRHS